MRNVLKAVCISCGAAYEAGEHTYTCQHCGGVLEILYDYDYIKSVFTKETLADRDFTMWRYRELLPIEEGSELTPLRIGGSPLYRAERLGKILGLKKLYIKDDGLNPTSSLKDRASAIAVVRAKQAGMDTVACSSTGNAASSLAGNAAAMGLRSFIFVPERAPAGKLVQLLMFGANLVSVKGNYEDAFRLSAQAIEKWGWYNRNAAVNPYLSEGKKTVSLEIAEQLGAALSGSRLASGKPGPGFGKPEFRVPDYVAVSVGDGCTIAGLWKGFKDLYAIGFTNKLPRLISVQAAGCCPVNRAIKSGKPLEPMEENTIADSIAVGTPRNGEKAIRAIRESEGITVNVSDQEILASMRLLGSSGIFGEPAGATGLAGLRKAAEGGLIPEDALAVSVVTGNGLKDVAGAQKAAAELGQPISIPADMELLVEEFGRRNIRP
ncbi:MAG: threonine synthase [Treponema sp.]|jgi:threonine synthase|nr:threonine synthase [Treponema sp.]